MTKKCPKCGGEMSFRSDKREDIMWYRCNSCGKCFGPMNVEIIPQFLDPVRHNRRFLFWLDKYREKIAGEEKKLDRFIEDREKILPWGVKAMIDDDACKRLSSLSSAIYLCLLGFSSWEDYSRWLNEMIMRNDGRRSSEGNTADGRKSRSI